ncbi:hypothetical protein [Peribacillus asahii]
MVYDYKEHPDIVSRRCDNCRNAQFESSVKNYIFLRKCRNCGMMKSI